MTETGAPRLRRVLGLTQVTASSVGIIIGAGIYVLLGPATAEAGGLVWLSFILAAVLCGLTGLSYAELSSMFPRAGAEYEYTRQVFPVGVAFVVGWVMTSGLVIAAAAIALGFARYLRTFVDIDVRLCAWILLAAAVLVALGGIRRSAWIVLLLGAVQVGGLVFVTVIGMGHLGEGRPAAGQRLLRRDRGRRTGVLRVHRLRRGHLLVGGDARPHPHHAARAVAYLAVGRGTTERVS